MKIKKKIDYKDSQIKVKVVKKTRPPADLTYAYGDVRDLGPIKRVYMKSRHLDEINDQIKDFLEEHKDMDMLVIRGNLEKIKGLEKLTNLQFLFLNNNEIEKIKGLDKLVNLKLLKLDFNNIEKIQGLDDLVKLRHLDLNNNDIEKIEGLGNLIHLEYLNLYRNPVYRWAKRKFGGSSMDRKKFKHPQRLVRFCQTGEIPEIRKRGIHGEIEAQRGSQRSVSRVKANANPSRANRTGTSSVKTPSQKATPTVQNAGLAREDIDFKVSRFCPSCGKMIGKNGESCPKCGVDLTEIKTMEDTDEISIEFAISALSDPDPNVREEALETLGSFKNEGALGVLTYLLFHDPSPEVRKEAADELGDIHHPYSLDALKKAMRDKNGDVRKEVISSLKKLKKKVVDKKD